MLPPLPKKMLFGTRFLLKNCVGVYAFEKFKNDCDCPGSS